MILDFLKTFNNLSNVFYTQENQIFDILASIWIPNLLQLKFIV